MSDIKGVKKTKDKLKRILIKYGKELKDILAKNSVLLATYTVQNKMQGGTTATKLRKRTAKLAASTKPRPVKKVKGNYEAGVKFGTRYAGVHIGKKGHKTVIRPVNKQYLAIPLKAAQTRAGVARGRPRDAGVFGKTFIAKSKAGNLIIFGKSVYQKGARAGQTHGKIVPLFVLKKQVTVPVRIVTKDLINWIKPKIERDLMRIKIA